jgi:hypothetical protein
MAYGSLQLATDDMRRGWYRAIAMGLLAAITAYFVAHSLWKPSLGRAVVQAVIEYDPGEGQRPLDLQQVRAEILSDESLTSTLQRSGLGDDVHAWKDAISVHRGVMGTNAGSERIVVEVATAQDGHAVDVLNRLTQQFLLAHAIDADSLAHGSTDLAAARGNLAVALAHEDSLRRGLDSQAKALHERLRRAEAKPRSESAAQPTLAPPTQVKRKTNPAWQKLQEDVAALESQREKMLLTLMPAHPKVMDVEGELEEIQSRLASMPRYLETPDAEEALTPSAPPAQVSEALLAAISDQQAKIKDATHAYEAARAKRLEAQAAVEVLERSTAEAPGKAPRFTLTQSAQVVDHLPTAFAYVRSAALVLLALLVLVVCSVVARPRAIRRLLTTADDITRLLHVPVIAELTLGHTKAV